MSFKDKVAVVTGAGKGIGRATALALAQEGAKVVLVGYRNESIALVQKEIEDLQGTAMVVKADVSSWPQVQQMAKAAEKAYGRVDLLVNNAGIEKIDKDGKRYSVLDLEDADWDYILGVNLKGQYHCIKAIAPDDDPTEIRPHRQPQLDHRIHRGVRYSGLLFLQGRYHRHDQVHRHRTGAAQYHGQLRRTGADPDPHARSYPIRHDRYGQIPSALAPGRGGR